MAELAQLHTDWNEYLRTNIVQSSTVLNAAVNSDRENTITEIKGFLKSARLSIGQSILESPARDKGGLTAALFDYLDRDRKPSLSDQLYDIVLASDEYKARLAANTPLEQESPLPDGVTPTTDNDSWLTELLRGSAITTAEVDAILRDGANDDDTTMRIAAHFAKGKDDNADFLRREYLQGRYGRSESATGKGFIFSGKQIAAWFDGEGIHLRTGNSTRGANAVLLSWEQAAARVDSLMLAGEYVSRDVFDEALDNERKELSESLWHFYRDDMDGLPEQWRAERGGYPDDVAVIKSLLDDAAEREAIHSRVEHDVASYDPAAHERRWHNRYWLLANMRDAMLPPVIFPGNAYRNEQDFKYFITDDELNDYLTRGGGYERKYDILSYFLHDHTPKERADFIKHSHGLGGGGTASEINGWIDYSPGKGVTFKRGGITRPDAEITYKWNAIEKRVSQLISEGRYMTPAELDRIPDYEKLRLAQHINTFYYNLPEEYKRPLAEKLPFWGYDKDDWETLRDFFDDGEQIEATFSQMKYLFENTPESDSYYSRRKAGYEALSAFRDGTYNLFPGVERLREPGAAPRVREPSANHAIQEIGEPMEGVEQMSLFSAPPIFPSVEEQQAKIEQTNEEAAGTDVPAASLRITQEEIDAALLLVSGGNRDRLAAQFAASPRSRETVQLVREIYGGIAETTARPDGAEGYLGILGESAGVIVSLGAPVSVPLAERPPAETLALPWNAVHKRLAELAAEGRLEVQAEAERADGERPGVRDYERVKAENGGAIVLWQNGDFFEAYGEDAKDAASATAIAMTERLLNGEPQGLVTGIPRHRLGYSLRRLNEAGFAAVVASAGANGERNITRYDSMPPPMPISYDIGDRLEYDGKPYEIDQINDANVRLHNLGTASPYPIFDYVTLGKADFERWLSDNNISVQRGEAAESEAEQPAPADTAAGIPAEDTISELQMETLFDEPAVSVELDFDAVAQTILERVMADPEYREAIAAAGSRASLRNACTVALEASIRDHQPDEPEVFRRYFGDDDFNDNLFSFVLRRSWEQRPQTLTEAEPEQAREPASAEPENDARLDAATEPPPAEALQAEATPAPIPVSPGSPPPVFVADWEQAKRDFDLRLYRDRDVIAYDKDGVRHQLGRSGNLNYVTSTGFVFGGNEVPGDIYEQIQAYGRGELTDGQARENYLAALEAFRGFKAADLESADGDLVDVLENTLLTGDERADFSVLMENGAANQQVVEALANVFSGTIDTTELISGETADYETTPQGLFISVLDKYDTKPGFSWQDIAPVVRSLAVKWAAGRERAPEPAAEMAGAETIPTSEPRRPAYIKGQRVVLDLRDKLRGNVLPDAPENAGEFIVDGISGSGVTVSKGTFSTILTSDEIERYTVNPVAEKLYEEYPPSGETRDYYLLRYPDGIDAGAALSHEELSLITEKADYYVICAEACYLSESERSEYNIVFRKMPRDWNLLPVAAQDKLRDFRPGYERDWAENDKAVREAMQTLPLPEQVRFDLDRRGFAVSDELIDAALEDYRSRAGDGNYEDIADFIEDEYLTDQLIAHSDELIVKESASRTDLETESPAEYEQQTLDMASPSRSPGQPDEPVWEKIEGVEAARVRFDLSPAPQREPPAPPVPQTMNYALSTVNYKITDDHLGEGGAKTKFRANISALQTLMGIEGRGTPAMPEEQEILSRYVGWGGLPQAFDAENKQWEREYSELKELLTQDEWESARGSTLNAHYTSPVIIKAIYEAVERLGFKTGNILEPSCGVGNFFGLLPDSMKASKLYGVELDGVTARIAKALYPRADIQHTGFEKTEFSDAFFDLAVGNVPFGDYGVADRRYKQNFSIHDYFFQKTLDKVRPGGVIAFVTSKWTMDKQNPEVRKYIAQRAELLGAVRLPNNAFLKNAGTETTMDILFLQKRDRPLDIEPEWVSLGLTEDGGGSGSEIPVNRYFLDNPEMVLGKMALDERVNNKYGANTSTTCLPIEGADLAQQLKTALSLIQGQYIVEELDDLDGVDNHAIPADPSVKNFSYALVTPSTEPDAEDGQFYAESIGVGRVYFRENSLMYPVDLPATTLERIKGMIALRDCVHKLISLQLDDYGDDAIKARQEELSSLYDAFTAEYGLISSTANRRAFDADSAYYLLCSLEVLDEEGNLARKADMFTKRTIKQKTVITHVDTASEALAVSLGEKARVDLPYMSQLTGMSEEALYDELRGIIFLNIGSADSPEKAYVTADEYLSGDVRKKLESAKAAALADPMLEANVKALEAAQPKDLDASEIAVRLGSTWISTDYVQQFMNELLNLSSRNRDIYRVKYHEITGEWQITGKGKAQYNDISATVTYGTTRMNAYEIICDTLNLRDARVYDYSRDADGKQTRTLNKKETMLAQQRQELIKQAFKDWIWKDPERRQTLVKLYNEKFNSVRPREYDGSHLTFGGISQEITMRPHQLNAIAHGIYGGNTLLAHVVGAGKTFEMAALAMESKRLGLCQKSLIAVPNHLPGDIAADFLRLYPSANILVATKKDFEMRNRKKFCAKIATGDYDAVIIGHSQLEKIPMSRERQERLIQDQLWEIEEGIDNLKRNEGERYSIKQLEKTRKSLEARLKNLLEAKTRDDVVTFEQLGVDRLFVDEAHNFKNLFLYTKMRNVAGLSTSEAQKSSDLFMKCRYMDELTGGKGVIFATGTPISNSMSEMYTMQRYLQYDTLVEKGLAHFDCWASIFGETVTSIELAPEGTGYRARTRFAKFHNLPELITMFKDVADIKTADMLNLPVPEAHYETVIVEPSELQKEMVQELSKRAAEVHANRVDAKVDNMLKITTDGRKIGLDQRLINPLLPDFEGSKVNACAGKIFEVWDETRAGRLTQLVFCDFSTPNKDGRFNVYDDIKNKLLERGVPESDIAFIHDADTDARKKELFAKVRQGRVRILFGSTFKMGAGTNVQDKLVATHDVDCPWRPADLEQRAGRIVRQGNKNPEVRIFRYATSGTFDSYLWQTVENKQKFISQIMSSKSPVRSCEDVDETALSYAEIKALCAGNPLIAEKMNLDIEVTKLRLLKAEYQSQRYRLEDSLLTEYPKQAASAKATIAGLEKDVALYAGHKEKLADLQPALTEGASHAAPFPGMAVDGVDYAEKEPAAKALIEACTKTGDTEERAIGSYMGFQMAVRFDSFSERFKLSLRGSLTYTGDLGTDAFGNITRINNTLDGLSKRLDGERDKLAGICRQQEAAKLELEKPFALEAELAEKEGRLALLNSDLNIDGEGGLDVENDDGGRVSSGGSFEIEAAGEPDAVETEVEVPARQEAPEPQRDDQRIYVVGVPRDNAPAETARASILNGIRSFAGGGKSEGSQGKERSAEQAI